MKKRFILVPAIIAGLLLTFTPVSGSGAGSVVKPDLDFGAFPLYFTLNKGQVNQKARFYARASRYTLWLTNEGLVFDSASGNTRRDVSRFIFLDALKDAAMVPLDESKLQVNYLKGKNKSNWYCNVSTSLAVLYKGLYKNIDLKVYGIEKEIEYDWIVKPGGDPARIKVRYENVNGTRIDQGGNLLVQTDSGQLVHKRPVGYQEIGGKLIPVEAEFKRISKNTFGFEVGGYDKEHELVIDPVVMAYSTYLGGNGNDFAMDIAVDNSGGAYVTGFTYSTDFPLDNEYQDDQTDIDVFVTRIDTTLSGNSSLIYSTYLGGVGSDKGGGIAVDSSGIVYVAGATQSVDFPTLNQYQDYQGNGDVFIVKIDTTQSGASSLVYSTCLGGSGSDYPHGIGVDSNGFAYVGGHTSSDNFPLSNQYQGRQGGADAFVSKIDTTLGVSGLLYSTYLGSSGDEYARAIAVDNSGSVYLAGGTNVDSTDFPTLNGYQGNQPERDVFVTRIDTTQSGNSSLIYSTYLGGSDNDYGLGIAVDNSGNAYVTGRTESTDFPIRNQYQIYPGDGFDNAFITRIDTTQSGNSSLVYSTYLGGVFTDAGEAIAADNSGNAYVAGYTWSSDFPLLGQYQGVQGGIDVFVTKIDTTQSGVPGLILSTLLGGSAYDDCSGIAVDNSGAIYVTGYTDSSDFPLLKHCQVNQPDYCAFVTKLNEYTLATVTTGPASSLTTTTASGGGNVTSQGDSPVTARGVCWSISPNPTISDDYTTDGSGTGSFSSSLTGLIPGTLYYVRAYATNTEGTAYGSTVTFTTFVNPTISGTVYEGNSPLKGVTIKFSHNQHTQTTGADGTYSYTVGYGTTTKVTAAKAGYTFTPERYLFANLAANSSNRDFTTVDDTPVDPPHIVLNRTRLNYGSIIGGAQTGSQTLLIENSGGSVLNWNASVSDTWITVTPVTGAENMLASVSIDATGLTVGSYRGIVSVIDANADNSPADVEIYLEVKNPAQETPPMGIFDAPTDGAAVYSSVPVTGWALDDAEVKSVKIYRDPIPGHETGRIYVGEALLVEGARPSVETRFDEYPKNYLAGWSYMLLTNYLPNYGNGTYVITAVAVDNSGNEVTLGSKTITCDNASAVKPFGAIDTPAQGGDASGTAFVNFGWVLTPQPNTIPVDGSTMYVYLDGVKLQGNPVYNLYREDIATGFPGYTNSNGAVGYYILDTAGYANGVHTISWTVTDNAGNSDGIGSRYFRVMNLDNPPAGSTSMARSFFRRGEIPPLERIPAKGGMITRKMKECQRIEIDLGADGSPVCAGFLVVNGQLRPLPVGSTLDTERGIFYWQAGGGFIGSYRFLFIKKNRAGQFEKTKLKVTVHPKY